MPYNTEYHVLIVFKSLDFSELNTLEYKCKLFQISNALIISIINIILNTYDNYDQAKCFEIIP